MIDLVTIVEELEKATHELKGYYVENSTKKVRYCPSCESIWLDDRKAPSDDPDCYYCETYKQLIESLKEKIEDILDTINDTDGIELIRSIWNSQLKPNMCELFLGRVMNAINKAKEAIQNAPY